MSRKHRAQETDRETALQTSQNEETDRIPGYPYTTGTQKAAKISISTCVEKRIRKMRCGPNYPMENWEPAVEATANLPIPSKHLIDKKGFSWVMQTS